jgi:transcriptional regulator with XRE-family HTH domain
MPYAAGQVLQDTREVDEVDLYIGRRLRRRRRLLGLTQDALARAVGVRFQQVQKYECAANRMCAARLHDFARALDVREDYFFEGLRELPRPIPDCSDKALAEIDAEFEQFAKTFAKLPPQIRRELAGLVRALAEEQASAPPEKN